MRRWLPQSQRQGNLSNLTPGVWRPVVVTLLLVAVAVTAFLYATHGQTTPLGDRHRAEQTVPLCGDVVPGVLCRVEAVPIEGP